MYFKNEELIAREIEIARYLVQHASLKNICENTGLSKKIVTAHIKNMMKKLEVADIDVLIQMLKSRV